MALDLRLTALALATGLVCGAAFKLVDVPMPAPPELPGLLGIVGVYLGYKAVESAGLGGELLAVLGLG